MSKSELIERGSDQYYHNAFMFECMEGHEEYNKLLGKEIAKIGNQYLLGGLVFFGLVLYFTSIKWPILLLGYVAFFIGVNFLSGRIAVNKITKRKEIRDSIDGNGRDYLSHMSKK